MNRQENITFVIIQCLRPSCRFRFPSKLSEVKEVCPKCGSATQTSTIPYTNNSPIYAETQNQNIEILLDNVRSAYNIGAILRTADAAAVSHLHVTGISPTPDQSKVIKTSLGAESKIPWTQHWNALECIQQAKENGYQIISFESAPTSRSIFDLTPAELIFPLLVVFGNEVSGVDPDILNISNLILTIPMYGEKMSLNIATAVGTGIYFLRYFGALKKADI